MIYFIFRDDKFILNRNEKNLQKNNDIFWNIKEYNTLYIFNNNKLLIKDDLEKFEIILNAIPKRFIKN